MGKVLKWVGIVIGILVVLSIALLLIVPRFIDINEYKPKIESMVTESTGRAFSIGGDIELTLFPWAGVSLSDVHLGNAKGFKEKDFLSVEHFDVSVKLIPLIFRDFQIKRFIVSAPRIVLEKDKGGRGNWEDLIKSEARPKVEKGPAPGEKPPLRVKNLMVGEFSIASGEFLWIDHQKGTEQRLTQINLVLDPILIERSVGFELSARLDGHPIQVRGEMGPFPRPVGEGKIPILLNVRAFDGLTAKVQGFLVDLGREPRFTLAMELEPFSPKEVAKAFGLDLSGKTRDPKALTVMSLKTTASGTSSVVALKDGLLKLDDSTLTFAADVREFEKPVVTFNIDLDAIDVDRYLPPSAGPEEAAGKAPGEAPKPKEAEKPDYTSLRKVVMDGTLRIGRMKVRGANLSDITLKVSARNGIIRVDPFGMKLYDGALSGHITFNVQQDTPTIKTAPDLRNVKVGPLLKDLGYTDRLDGLANFKADVSVRGTQPEEIKKTLNGLGEFALTDGAIVGFDLTQMVRNVAAAFGMGAKEKPRTEFSELKGNFTIKDGLLNNPSTYLASPLLRVVGKGTVDLVRETINYRVEPKFVGTLQGQGDTGLRSGLMVPVDISGTFADPKFRPDLRAVLKDENIQKEAQKLLEGLVKDKEGGQEGEAAEDALKALEELLPGLFSGKKK